MKKMDDLTLVGLRRGNRLYLIFFITIKKKMIISLLKTGKFDEVRLSADDIYFTFIDAVLFSLKGICVQVDSDFRELIFSRK